MKYALITPPNLGMKLLASFGLSYHMALAQYILADVHYKAVYQALHNFDHFIMVDNGAAENGVPLPIEKIVKAADMVGADEIVMPDVLDDMRATIKATYAALIHVKKKRRAVVPQGKDWNEWTDCTLELIQFGCRTICVAKRYEKLPGGRVKALEIIAAHGWQDDHDIHLLGCCKNPLKEIRDALNVAPWVRGIDTAAPVSYAQHGTPLTGEWHSLDWNKPIDWDVAKLNVQAILEACHNACYTKESGN
jgi:hypothetical protein